MDDSVDPHIHELQSAIHIDQSSGDALRAMDAEGLSFIPIVNDDGRLAGVALRAGIENGCWGMGHDPERCRVHTHLKVDVVTCGADDDFSGYTWSRARTEPVVVVGDGYVPVGVIVTNGET